MSKIVAIVAVHDSIESIDNDLDLIAQKTQKYEQARRLVETLAASKGGRVIGMVQGNDIVELPIEAAEVLKEIHHRLKEELNIHTEIGVGEDSKQATEALKYAQENAPASIKVYDPDMNEELSEPHVEEQSVAVGPDDVMTKSERYQAITPEDKQKIGQTLMIIQQNQPLFQQMKQQSPEVYQSIVGVVQSLTEIIQQDKINKEQDLVQMVEQINKEMKKRKKKKVNKDKSEINRHIKRHSKLIGKEAEEQDEAHKQKMQDKHKSDRQNASNFAHENGHDPIFLHKLLNAFRD